MTFDNKKSFLSSKSALVSKRDHKRPQNFDQYCMYMYVRIKHLLYLNI